MSIDWTAPTDDPATELRGKVFRDGTYDPVAGVVRFPALKRPVSVTTRPSLKRLVTFPLRHVVGRIWAVNLTDDEVLEAELLFDGHDNSFHALPKRGGECSGVPRGQEVLQPEPVGNRRKVGRRGAGVDSGEVPTGMLWGGVQ